MRITLYKYKWFVKQTKYKCLFFDCVDRQNEIFDIDIHILNETGLRFANKKKLGQTCVIYVFGRNVWSDLTDLTSFMYILYIYCLK